MRDRDQVFIFTEAEYYKFVNFHVELVEMAPVLTSVQLCYDGPSEGDGEKHNEMECMFCNPFPEKSGVVSVSTSIPGPAAE